MRLDGLVAEEQGRRDLAVRHAVGYEACDLELALGQRAQPGVAGRCGTARLGARSELAQLAADLVARADGVEAVELTLGLPQHGDRLLALVRGGERAAVQAARERRLQPGASGARAG